MNIQQFLERRDVSFRTLEHEETFDAQHLAQAIHVTGEAVVKSVLMRADDSYVLAVVPATHTIDLKLAKKALGCEVLALATEKECGSHFPDCELGVLPPFGSHYGMKTLVDASLMADDEIVFEANTHHEAIRLRLQVAGKPVDCPVLASYLMPCRISGWINRDSFR